jgi:hypothetical protein
MAQTLSAVILEALPFLLGAGGLGINPVGDSDLSFRFLQRSQSPSAWERRVSSNEV